MRQVRVQRGRGGERGIRRDLRRKPRKQPLVLRDPRPAGQAELAAHRREALGDLIAERAEDHQAEQPRAAPVGRQAQPRQPAQQPGRACRARGRKEGYQRGGVVQLAGILQGVRAQQVGEQQRQAEQQHLRAEQRQAGHGQQQPDQIARAQRLGRDAQDRQRPRNERDHHIGKRVAQRAITRGVGRLPDGVGLGRKTRDDDEGRDIEPGQPEQRDRGSGREAGQPPRRAAPREQAARRGVQAEGDGEQRGALLRHGNQGRGQCKPSPTALVDGPERGRDEGRGQRQRVELADGRGLQCRGQQIGRGKGCAAPCSRAGREERGQPAPRKQIDGPRARGEQGRLQHQQRAHVVPQPEDERDRQEDGLHMVGEPRAGPVDLGLLEESTVRGVPDGLIHLAQVGLVRELRLVQADAIGREPGHKQQHQAHDGQRGRALRGRRRAPAGGNGCRHRSLVARSTWRRMSDRPPSEHCKREGRIREDCAARLAHVAGADHRGSI
ncbi:MAG: hypothetical protein BWY52_03244 [Chloroflexi bacterium ADurb.Bin325]|nr:MAG: hypothetical protein BWY52_03244 [Chloroflexi bacterium ADurb.Bin325]